MNVSTSVWSPACAWVCVRTCACMCVCFLSGSVCLCVWLLWDTGSSQTLRWNKRAIVRQGGPSGSTILPPSHAHTHALRRIHVHTVHSHIQTYTEFAGHQTNTHNTHLPLPNHSFVLEGGSCTKVNIWVWDVNAGLCKLDTRSCTHTHLCKCTRTHTHTHKLSTQPV